MADTQNADANNEQQQNNVDQNNIQSSDTKVTSVEDKIGATLDRLDGEHGVKPLSAPANTEAGDTKKAGEEAKPAAGAKPNAGDGKPGAGDGTQQPNNTQQARVRTKDDGKGNLVNAQTGEMIAPAGPARRFYTEAQQLRNEVTQLRQTAQQAQQIAQERDQFAQQVEALRTANTLATQLGLSVDESVMSHKLFAQYKKAPIDTLKYMLTEAQAAGHDISSLLQGGHIATDAIGKMIDTKLAPLTQRMQTEEQQETIVANVRREYTNFINQYPDASVHENEIAAVMRKTGCELTEAYLRVQNFALQNGYDWNKPLRAQIEARNNGTALPAPSGAPMIPSGRANGRTLAPANRGADPANMSSADIVRASMREAGLNV
jgi:hypothetical protein